jgi:hypothetical protein
MNNDPIHIGTYYLEEEHIDQIITNSIWVTSVRLSRERPGMTLAPVGGCGTVALFVDTEHRADAEGLLAELHVTGSNYTARFGLVESDERRLFTIRLATPHRGPVVVGGIRNDELDKAFQQADYVAIVPARDGNVDIARTITIGNDNEFWQTVLETQ